jgi:hypothetical protein
MFLLLLGSEANVFELHPIKIRQKKLIKGVKKSPQEVIKNGFTKIGMKVLVCPKKDSEIYQLQWHKHSSGHP